MLRRTLLSSLLQTALLGAAGGIGSAPGKAAARNNARSAPVEECEADLVIVGSGAAGLSAGLAALEAGVRKVVILEKAAIAGGHTMLASGSVSAVFGADVDKLIDAMLTAGAGENNPALVETLARQSGAAFEWLAEHGVNWMKTPYRAVGSPGAWSYSTGSAQAGYDYVQCLNRAYHRLGGAFFTVRAHRRFSLRRPNLPTDRRAQPLRAFLPNARRAPCSSSVRRQSSLPPAASRLTGP